MSMTLTLSMLVTNVNELLRTICQFYMHDEAASFSSVFILATFWDSDSSGSSSVNNIDTCLVSRRLEIDGH